MIYQINLVITDFHRTFNALIDSGINLNCIQEGLIPTKYYEKIKELLKNASGINMQINYKLENAHIY